MKRGLQRFLLGLLLLLAVTTLVGIGFAARLFKTAEPGAPADYWEYLCGVQLPSFSGHGRYAYSGGVYPSLDGLLYYYEQHHHDQRLFVVPQKDVLGTLPLVQEHLTLPHPPESSECPDTDRSKCTLYERAAPRRESCRASLVGVSTAQATSTLEALRIQVEDQQHGQYREQSDTAFRERIRRADRVWLTFAFEVSFLAAWLLFVAWPLFGVARLNWPWRLGLAPFLLFLPYFLGYAPMTFTFGPSGGFVYPGYLMLAALPMQLVPCSVLDRVLWELLPSLLAPLSQVPGSPAGASRMFCVGPASSLIFGALLVAVMVLTRSMLSKLRARRAES